MQLILISILKKPKSHYGGDYYYVIFKGVDDRKVYRLTLQPTFGNFKRWDFLFRLQLGSIIEAQTIGKIVNGDSLPRIVKRQDNFTEQAALNIITNLTNLNCNM